VNSQEIIKEFLTLKGWEKLNTAQLMAVDDGILNLDENFVIIAPTATGKTGMAEMAMLQTLFQNSRVAYLVPMQSLISSKTSEFSYLKDKKGYSIFPDKIDKTRFNNADIVIDTFESFYRITLNRPDWINDFGIIIIDEFHVLYDKTRGYNLEKVITLIKNSSARIFCLSATFEDKNKVSDWLDARLVVIPEKERSVTLKHGYIDLSNEANKAVALHDVLNKHNKNPTIIFCNRRDHTESRAVSFSILEKEEINSYEELNKELKSMVNREKYTSQEAKLLNCITKGTGFHHSKMSDELKKWVETYFLKGKIKYLFSTTTLAYGMNFPAKSVVLCDTEWWTGEKNEPIPVHTYLQMAGRAGRGLNFANEGYAFVVANKKEQLKDRIPSYLNGKIDEAYSHIAYDDFFRKTILELIYSGRNSSKGIISFFENSFYHYLESTIEDPLIPYDLKNNIRPHIQYIAKYGFITGSDRSGFRLTDLGEVVITFLFQTYKIYILDLFIKINQILDEKMEVEYNFDFIYNMFLIFDTIHTSKIPRKRSKEVDEYFLSMYHDKNKGIKQLIRHPEYSAYAVYYGWIENVDEVTIEDRFKVNPTPIKSNCIELYNLLGVYENLAKKKNINIPDEFLTLRRRILEGVTAEELPFKIRRNIGRETSRNLKDFCNNTLRRPDFNYKGNMMEVLYQLYKNVGEEEFLNIMIGRVTNIAKKRGGVILDVIKKYEKSVK